MGILAIDALFQLRKLEELGLPAPLRLQDSRDTRFIQRLLQYLIEPQN
jgi:hypothetical protein